jgi:glucoamylase
VLQETIFVPLIGAVEDYRVYSLLAPHLVNAGMGNTAWCGDYKGVPMLFASGSGGTSLALASSAPWGARSVGYVGVPTAGSSSAATAGSTRNICGRRTATSPSPAR